MTISPHALLEEVRATDLRRAEADAEYDRATAIIIRKCGGETLWGRCLRRMEEERHVYERTAA